MTAELGPRAQVDLRLDPREAARVEPVLGTPLPLEPNTSARGDGVEALWLGPDEWLLLAAAGTERELERRLRAALAGVHCSVVDVSASRTAFELAGPGARGLLAHGCALDLHPRAFPVGGCAQTLLARAQVILHRVDEEVWHVLVRPSFARYLRAWLADAAAAPGP